MFRKFLALTVLMMLLCTCAQAEITYYRFSSPVFVPGTYVPATIASSTGSDADALLDGMASTVWKGKSFRGSTDTPDLTFLPGETTLSAIWIRIGDQASSMFYESSNRPATIKVDMMSIQSGVLQIESYTFSLVDLYQPDRIFGDWYKGYQRMQLPHTIKGLVSVSLTIESLFTSGVDNPVLEAPVCISDILFEREKDNSINATPTERANVQTTLLSPMDTRSGPNITYDETGSYFEAGHNVTALSYTYGKNDTTWVQVEFTYQNGLRRAYTEIKHVNVETRQLVDEECVGFATLTRQVTPRYGPGADYEAHNFTLDSGLEGILYAIENGWAQFHYHDETNDVDRRVWVEINALVKRDLF